MLQGDAVSRIEWMGKARHVAGRRDAGVGLLVLIEDVP
jgi:hypothetical protein